MRWRVRVSTDVIANLAILATCAILSIGIIRQLSLSQSSHVSRDPRVTAFEVGRPVEPFPNGEFQAKATVLLYLSTECKYCTESMPFYRSLVGHVRKAGRVGLAVASTESMDVVKSYLASHELSVDQILRSQLSLVPTPTLVVVDQFGRIQRYWLGEQNPSGEKEILQFLDTI